ncbi:MAG: FecR family protein [Chitinophagaceae bacterium]|nr:FecR family protein [Chitinophagaceae bacterium]
MNNTFSDLIDAYLTDALTEMEEAAFFEMLNIPENRAELDYILGEKLDNEEFIIVKDDDRKTANLVRLQKRIDELNSGSGSRLTAHRFHFLRTQWIRYAAAVVILFTTGAYLWNNNKINEQTITNGGKPLQTDVAPGGERAVLTLADGTKIILDSVANGNLAQQGNAQIVKLASGQVIYNVEGLTSKEIMWNTMSTPTGGQYQVTLPDGTKVWLNAASSITYPAAFVDKKRQVKVTGEAYFEVAKNKQKPFIVDIDGKSTIQVLGTSFNINSYADEGDIMATLLEGSLKVSNTNINAAALPSEWQSRSSETNDTLSTILKPGQQATIAVALSPGRRHQNLKGIVVTSKVDLDQALAWKNGLFNFDGLNVREVMKQLERWYDIKVKFEGPMPALTFRGKMFRNVNLSDVLEMLEKMEIKFRMEGKILIVL